MAALAKKLGVVPGDVLCVLGDRAEWLVSELPEGVEVRRRLSRQRIDLVILFCAGSAQLEKHIDTCAQAVRPDGTVWVAWPRKAAGHRSDLGDNAVRTTCLARGLVDVKVAALSEDWSALRFVWRKELRRPSARNEQ